MFFFIVYPLLAVVSAVGASTALLGALMKLDKDNTTHQTRLSRSLPAMVVHFIALIFAATHIHLVVAMTPFYFIVLMVLLAIGFVAAMYYKAKAPL